MNDENYYVVRKDGYTRPSCLFGNLRKKNKGRSPSEIMKICEFMLERACKEHPQHVVALNEVYDAVCNNPEVPKAADFIVTLAPTFSCTTPARSARSSPRGRRSGCAARRRLMLMSPVTLQESLATGAAPRLAAVSAGIGNMAGLGGC